MADGTLPAFQHLLRTRNVGIPLLVNEEFTVLVSQRHLERRPMGTPPLAMISEASSGTILCLA